MKKIFTLVLAVIGLNLSITAQTNKVVALEQTKGEFTQKTITLSEGSYTFEISNNNVGHDVGFVITPKGKNDAKNHIKEAYVTKPVENNSKSVTNLVTLKKGEYNYFCPLNPTPIYTLIVQ